MKNLSQIFILLLALQNLTFGQDAKPTLSYEILSQIIKNNNVKTIDQLIPLLPADYKSNYTFMYESMSAQAPSTSPDYPRAILFGNEAKFVLTFTKNPAEGPKVDASDTLELMEWNSEKSRFEFRELTFDGETDPLTTASKVNPDKCLQCHGNPPRPNWDAYNMWPGAYGSISRRGCDYIKIGSKEHTYYQSFMSHRSTASRYKDLTPPMKPEGCLESPEHIPFTSGALGDPNAILTQKLAELNFQRLQSLVKASPQYENYKYALAYAVNCAAYEDKPLKDFESVFSVKARKLGTSIKQTHASVVAQGLDDFENMKKRFQTYNAGYSEESKSKNDFSVFNTPKIIRPISNINSESNDIGRDAGESIAMMKYLFDRLGIKWEKISMGFLDGTYAFGTPNNLDLLKLLLPAEDDNTYCKGLKDMSLKATATAEHCEMPQLDTDLGENLNDISNVLEMLPTIPETKDPELKKLGSCIGCHNVDNPMGGLILNLQSKENFQEQLIKKPALGEKIRDHLRGMDSSGNKLIQMPFGNEPFSGEDQKKINDYIERLVK